MLRVMIAEDDLIIAEILAEIIVQAGYRVCGIACAVDEAIEIGLTQKPDVAILDLRLADGGLGTEVAARLAGSGQIGVLYTTANLYRLMLTSANGHACLSKPFSPRTLLRSLRIVADIAAARTVSLPFPPGFRMLPSSPVLHLGQSFLR